MRRTRLLVCSALALGAVSLPSLVAADTHDEAGDQEVSVALSEHFAAYDDARLALSPQAKAYRGIRDGDYGKWNDPSDAAAARDYRQLQAAVAQMQARFDLSDLTGQDALSYRLFEATGERDALLFPFREYGYVFTQMGGAHTGLPAFLINIHQVSEPAHARAYIDRMEALGPQLDALRVESAQRAEAGITPPDWVYPYLINDIEALIAAGDDNAVLQDFNTKVSKLGPEIPEGSQSENSMAIGLMSLAQEAWVTSALPAYQRLLAELKRQQAFAPDKDGVWRLPDGEAYYAARLKSYTTTDLTADEIHNIGLEQVERIHGEMRAIMA
ncbi:MAG: DUF885 family protein, partial [Pseudomonadota bacterium]